MSAPDFRLIFPGWPTQPTPSQVDDLRKAVDEAAGHARNATFLLLTICLYVGILGGTTTHRMLLTGEPVQLPLLNVPVSIIWAYGIAPVLVLAFHSWLMVAVLMLARRMDAFDHAAKLLSLYAERRQRQLLGTFPLVEWRLGIRHGPIEHALLSVLAWTLYVVAPIAALMWIELRFLPYQHEWLTPLQLGCVALDLVLIWATWPTVDGPTSSIPFRVLGGWASFATLATAGFLLIDQYADNRWSQLRVTDQILMKRSPAPEILAQARMKAEKGKEDEAETAVFLDPELTEPLNLKGRNLRRANFSNSRMLGVVLDDHAILSKANLAGADLQKAQAKGAQLQGASLDGARLQGASLDGAQLQGASLDGAQLQGASLDGARLQGASLVRAQLQGASLDWARLQGARLIGAQLQGASLDGARLQGASLVRAQLQGASLVEAQLQGARLILAQLQGASLDRARLQGARLDRAQLQGASLIGAGIWGSSLTGADFSFADLRAINTTPPEQERVKVLRDIAEDLPTPQLQERVLRLLAPLMDQSRKAWVPERIAEDQRRKIRFGGIGGLPSLEAEILFDAGSEPDEHAVYLAQFLEKLACGDGDVAHGVEARMGNEVQQLWAMTVPSMDGDDELDFPYHPFLARKLLDPACKGAAGFSAEDRAELELLASASSGSASTPYR